MSVSYTHLDVYKRQAIYNWSFGDGGTSTVANPTHTYANFGWYNACLVVSGTYNNQYVSCTYCDSVFVPNNVPCNASFIYTPSGNTCLLYTSRCV